MNRQPLRILLAAFVALVALPAQGTITDSSFESGFGAWVVFGDVLLDDTSGPPQFGTPAPDGDFQLFMSTLPNEVPDAGAPLGGAGPFSGNDAVLTAALETSLGLSAGEIDALSPSGNLAIHGSGLYQEFTSVANSVLSFEWNFLTNEPPPTATYTDFLFWGITASGGGPLLQSGVLMDTSQDTEFGPSPAQPTFDQETGYRSFSTTITAAGAYRLLFAVVDVNDQNYTSAVMIDLVTVIPEASTGILIFLGLGGLVAAGGRPAFPAPFVSRDD